VVDVSDANQVSDWIDKTVSRFGRLDGAANIAGIFKPKSLFNSTMQDWDLMMNVNAKGVFNCLQAQIAGIGDRGGSIVRYAVFVFGAPLISYANLGHCRVSGRY
jgi:NAD(P)-dependent dehydrogenase (short-subunit alcohol dehydrogenase family)